LDIDGELLERASRGDRGAFARLIAQHESGLRQAIRWRMDRRLAARLDASDVLQEAMIEAARRLADYSRQPAMPFGLWLRWLVREKLLQLERVHFAEMRAVTREAPLLPVDSSAAAVRGLMGREPSPSRAAADAELAEQLRRAIGQLDDEQRDLILWRHFEQLSNRDVAQLLGITEAAAGKRYIRALEQLRHLLLGANHSNA
jgi:RNA polymerase sigma-70 factor, ECF subfamily